MLEPPDQIVDIIVEIERAFGERHVARVGPVGDVDVVTGQHPLHGPAQQRREMARHRRDDQQLGVLDRAAFAHEVAQLPEGLARLDRLDDRQVDAVDLRGRQVEGRLSARRCSMGEHLQRGGKQRPATEIGEWICGILQEFHARGCDGTGTGQQVSL